MGGSSSKVSRTLPRTASKPSGIPTRNPPLERQRPPPASERKNEAIEADSKDPHLLDNLHRLGPVRVGRDIQNSLSTSHNVSRMLKTRKESETDANSANPTRNRLLAPALIDLLDERKTVASERDLERLAAKYNIDRDVLERLTRTVNSPSVDENTARKLVDEDGSEKVLRTATWISPRLS